MAVEGSRSLYHRQLLPPHGYRFCSKVFPAIHVEPIQFFRARSCLRIRYGSKPISIRSDVQATVRSLPFIGHNWQYRWCLTDKTGAGGDVDDAVVAVFSDEGVRDLESLHRREPYWV